jgi:5-methylcytosine-specific restriction endonuclease McrA
MHACCGEMDGAVNSVGSLRDLQVHHMQSRSLLGDDTEENLITLCAPCHTQIHLRQTN